jgi:phospholipase C
VKLPVLATATALLALGVLVPAPASAGASGRGGDPAAGDGAVTGEARTPVNHFITLMQENHSFDNYFGTYPGADGTPEGACMPEDNADPDGACVEPFRVGNRAVTDLGHSDVIFDRQFNGGALDGFISAYASTGATDADLTMGYYDDRDIPFYWNVADEFVLFDRFFTSANAGSVGNHMFWVAGQPGSPDGDIIPPGGFDTETIFDRLEDAGVSWKFYVQNYDPEVNLDNRGDGDRAAQVVWVPLLNFRRYLDDPDLFSHIVPLEEYYDDLDNGTLPEVSYIVPSGASEHPPGSIAAGEAFVRTLLNGLMRSSAWDSSAFTWTYDDWGGWYDHVRPPQIDQYGYGFRAPALLVSPYARRGHVDSTTLDFTSILAFIEHNWDLEPLATRDAQADPMIGAFDFERPPRPPQLVDSVRDRAVPEPPRRSVVYLSYSVAVGAFGILVSLGFALDRRRRRSVDGPGRPGGGGPSTDPEAPPEPDTGSALDGGAVDDERVDQRSFDHDHDPALCAEA